MNRDFWESFIDFLQRASLGIAILVVFLCVIVLILFDVLVGAGTMMYLTQDDIKVSIFISMATTGLLVSLMFTAYSLFGSKNKVAKGMGWFVLIGALGVYCLDVYFDSLAADILRFNAIVDWRVVQNPEVHLLYRILIGGLSTVGEGLAVAIITGMPVLKEIINKVIPDNKKQDNKPKQPERHSYVPPYKKGSFRLDSDIEEALKRHRTN